jgi:hypothetical protein
VSQAFPPLGPEFEPFLYAILYEDGNGNPLTMVSAIARAGADPWKEAERIAKMPKTAALDALAGMIPERSGADGAAIADRLFALLPTGRENRIASVVGVRVEVPRWSPLVPAVLVLLLVLAVASAFRMTWRSDERKVIDAPSAPPVADKADP